MAEQDHNKEHDEIEGSDDPQITELVAYLDGELPEQDADRVERMLQANALLRRDAECLDRTWQLLDSLESATASGEFTQKTLSTISTIADRGEPGVQNGGRWSLKKLLPASVLAKGLIWCLAGFLACSTGLVLSRKARRERTDRTDAKILKNLDLYLRYPKLWRIPDVQFLKDVSSSAESSAEGGHP
jgi:anti-sigma factor RsiW